MADSLLPCPFCGDRPQTKEWNVGDREQIKIWCDGAGCHVHPSVFGNRETMLQQWNTRKADALTVAELKMLVRRLAIKLPKDSPLRLQAVDYLRRKFVPSDILRGADDIGRVEKT